MIHTRSYIPSELKNGHKLKQNVKDVYAIILDFDKNEPTLKEMLEKIKDWKYCCVLHTSRNHQKNKIDPGNKARNPGKRCR